MNLTVVDLSSYDREPNDWAAAKAAGLVGVIHKATQGTGYVDKLHDARRKAVTDAGLLWGSFHFADASSSLAQLTHFLSVAQPDANTLVALDFEPLSPQDGGTMSLAGATQFLGAALAQIGRRPVLYSGNLIKEDLGATVDPFFGAHRLWLAQYAASCQWQASWKNYWLWQFSDGTAGPQPRTLAGIRGDDDGNLDCNHYAGTPQQLAAEWSGGTRA